MQAQVLLATGDSAEPEAVAQSAPHCQLVPELGVGFGIGVSVGKLYSRKLAGASFDACVRMCTALLHHADARRDYACAAVVLQLSPFILR